MRHAVGASAERLLGYGITPALPTCCARRKSPGSDATRLSVIFLDRPPVKSPTPRQNLELRGRGTPSIYRCHSTNVFLNHAQMNPETVQIDFEGARDLEHPHGGFNFCESCLILAKPGSVGAVSEFAFKISQSSVQLIDAMNVEPPVKAG